MGLQRFPTIANHRSNDGMVTIHLRGLPRAVGAQATSMPKQVVHRGKFRFIFCSQDTQKRGTPVYRSFARPDHSGAVQHGDTRVTTQRSHTKTGTQGRYTRGQTRVTTQRTPANLTHRPGSRAAQHTSNNTTITSTHPHSGIIPKSAEEVEEEEEEEEEKWTPI